MIALLKEVLSWVSHSVLGNRSWQSQILNIAVLASYAALPCLLLVIYWDALFGVTDQDWHKGYSAFG
jgi:hypothetical protein